MTTTPSQPSRENGRSDLFSGLALLLRNLPLLAIAGFVGVVLGGAATILKDASWVTESRISPQSDDAVPSAMSGLASRFGFDVAGAAGAKPLEFYVEILRSDELLSEVARSEYTILVEPDSVERTGTLLELWEIEGGTDLQRRRAAIERLRQVTSVGANPDARLVNLRVVSEWPELAVQVNSRMLDLLNEHNIRQRQEQARAEAAFIAARMEEATTELEAAEETLGAFMEENRGLEAPRLQLELERLQRRVDLRQQVFLALVSSLENSRVAAVRSTPLITMIAGPEASLRPEATFLFRNVILGGTAGVLLALAWVMGRVYVRIQAVTDPAGLEAVRAAAGEGTRLFRPGRGPGPGSNPAGDTRSGPERHD